ncbi:MAG TPA: glycoside hydrolase family 43 protein [Anaerolineales bacterium]|nr:glycoside hydrolase family 43 protein [Anaerolineales bacterium]
MSDSSNRLSFTNPILPGFYPDPSICRAGDDYFLINSSFEYFPGVPVFHSRDLWHWRQVGHCLTRPSQLPLKGVRASGGIFAPTIRHHDGVFYMITTNVSAGGNFIVTTRDPFGEWSEPIWVAQGGIDPSLCFDDGHVYLTSTGQGPDPDNPERTVAGIVQSEIDPSTGKLLTEPRLIWAGTGGSYPEGPHLYRIGDWYYLMIAEGGTEFGHTEVMARSRSPWGPWEPCPHNPILTHRSTNEPIQGTGHADLVEAADGSWWMVCLGFRPVGVTRTHHLGRETFLAPVVWGSDGWPRVGDSGRIKLEMEAPHLTPVEWESAPVRDDFDRPELDLSWNFMSNPSASDWSLAEKPGWLSLHGNAASLDDGAGVAFVGRRQQHFNCEVNALLDFAPDRQGQEAGLTVWMSPRHYAALYITFADGQRFIGVRRRIGALFAEVSRQPLPAGPITLVARAHRTVMQVGIQSDAQGLVILDTFENCFLSSEVAGGFTGVYFALYASAGGSFEMPVAQFDWFDYRGLDGENSLGLDTPMHRIMADPAALAIVAQHVPGIAHGVNEWAAQTALADWVSMSAAQFPVVTLNALSRDLKRLEGR